MVNRNAFTEEEMKLGITNNYGNVVFLQDNVRNKINRRRNIVDYDVNVLLKKMSSINNATTDESVNSKRFNSLFKEEKNFSTKFESKELDYILFPLFFKPGLFVVCGDSGSYKTMLMLDMCNHVANGKKWLTYYTKKTNTLHIDFEMGTAGLLERKELLNITSGNQYVFAMSDEIDFLSVSGQNDIIDYVLTRKIGVIVIDSFRTVFEGNENDSGATQKLLNAFNRIAKLSNTAVIVIHHTNKDGSGYRGSGSIKASADGLYTVTSSNSNITLHSTKQRYGTPFHEIKLFIDFDDDKCIITNSTPQLNHNLPNDESAILQSLINAGSILRTNSNKLAISKLLNKKFIRNNNFRGEKADYRITNAGRRFIELESLE